MEASKPVEKLESKQPGYKIPCKNFIKDECKFGDDCLWKHELSLCKFQKACKRSETCNHIHPKQLVVILKIMEVNRKACMYNLGTKCKRGDKCTFLHFDRINLLLSTIDDDEWGNKFQPKLFPST